MNSKRKNVICFSYKKLWSQSVYRKLLSVLREINKKNEISIMLTGGNTAKKLFISWHQKRLFSKYKFKIFFTDERCVSPKSVYSNFKMIQETLLKNKSFSKHSIYRIESEKKNLFQAMKSYSEKLPKSVDILILSLAEDGHIASIFPNKNFIKKHNNLVGLTDGKVKGFKRISILPKVIDNAKNVLVLVAGFKRGELLAKELNHKKKVVLPMQFIKSAIWLLDFEATVAYKRFRKKYA